MCEALSVCPLCVSPAMEESHDMPSKGAIIPPEKTKRKLKTRAQIEALEKFYNENKYPSESMKLQFAKQIGLSEKQVAGWFCHRRLKDKKLLQGEDYVNGKHSFSSGDIHDHINGLRQESCSSTKQGDKHFDSKEIESKGFYSHNCSLAAPASEHNHHINVGDYTVGDDRYSGSSLASQERLLKQNENPYAVTPSRSFRVGNMLMNTRGVKGRTCMTDSRYSYSQAEMENPAVSSVKWKLGRHYRGDGPTLSVVFDPLPPGAFDSPIKYSNFDPYYVGDSIHQTSYRVPRTFKEPKLYDKYRCEMLSKGSYPEGICLEKPIQGSLHYNESTTSSQLTQKVLLTKHSDHASNRTFVMENSEDSAGKDFDYKSRKNGKHFKYRLEGDSNNTVAHHFCLRGLKAHTNKSLSYPLVLYNCSEPVFEKEVLGTKFLKPALETGGFLHNEDSIQPRRPIRKGRIPKVLRTVKNHNLVRENMLMICESKTGKKANGMELRQQNYPMKSSRNFQRRNTVLRYSGDVTTRFGEDGTACSASSVN